MCRATRTDIGSAESDRLGISTGDSPGERVTWPDRVIRAPSRNTVTAVIGASSPAASVIVPLLSSGVLSAALLVRPQIDPRFPDRSRDRSAAGEGRPQREKAGRTSRGPAAAGQGPLAAAFTSP